MPCEEFHIRLYSPQTTVDVHFSGPPAVLGVACWVVLTTDRVGDITPPVHFSSAGHLCVCVLINLINLCMHSLVLCRDLCVDGGTVDCGHLGIGSEDHGPC